MYTTVRDVRPRPPASWFVAAAIGTAIGSGARFAIGRWVLPGPTGVFSQATLDRAWPWATLLVNVLGCAAIGWFATRLERETVRWHFVVTGVLGGFTTMSAVAIEANRFADADEHLRLVIHLAVTLVGGAAALLVAEFGARRTGRSR